MRNNASILGSIAIAISGLNPVLALGQIPAELHGTWVIDAKQTQERLIQVGPPSNNAEWLPAIIVRQCVTTMTFDKDTMTIDLISHAPTTRSFRLEPHEDKKLTYTIQTASGGKDTLTVSFLDRESITVKSAKVELDEYGVWKRGNRPNQKTVDTDFQQSLDACLSALKNVPFIKEKMR